MELQHDILPTPRYRVLTINRVMESSPLLYDRGYPAFWLFALHIQEQRQFCARMSLDFSGEVTAFLASGKKSDVVLFSPGTEARKQCRDYGLSCAPIPLRLIRVQLKGGETEVLATSLLDEEAHPKAWFKRLYHLRWGVGVSGRGHLIQSVKVRPRPRDSSLVAWEAPWRESKTVKPFDNVRTLAYSNLPGCNVQ